ncbi:septum formation initiator family protein [Hydrogenophaga sp. 5NK40-0174]|uniref:septum formation initiator family protein n=1 Tax=Hydrogenophaga sp. 5NK40-0174 TaxID=3127649 RepID=UPI0031041ED7
MVKRIVPALLVGLLLILQAQIWFGRGSIPKVTQLRHELTELEAKNRLAKLRNDQVASEVNDLQDGLGVIEELAREELGMVKPNEVFVQVAYGPGS